MDYSDLDHIEITDEQYHANLLYQYPELDAVLTIAELEDYIDSIIGDD